jgi:hypothetical protein
MRPKESGACGGTSAEKGKGTGTAMMHKRRVYKVSDRATDAGVLADLLTRHDWCTCNGFRLGHLLFLNDSTGPDGAQEYAVFDERSGKQIESLTVSWMTPEKLAAAIDRLMAEGTPDTWQEGMPSLNHPEGCCYACA